MGRNENKCMSIRVSSSMSSSRIWDAPFSYFKITSLSSIIMQLIECFHSRDYRPYWFTETKESICIKIEFNSQRFSLGHQHGRHFFVLGHQHGRRDVMWKHSIVLFSAVVTLFSRFHYTSPSSFRCFNFNSRVCAYLCSSVSFLTLTIRSKSTFGSVPSLSLQI